MNILKNPQTNWKYILIVIILTIVVGGGILGWQWWMTEKEEWWMTEKEVKLPVEKPAIEEPTLNLATTKLAVIPKGYPKPEVFSDFKYYFSYVDQSVQFSPNGYQVAYVVDTIDEKGGWIEAVVFNGEEGKFYDLIGDLIFSPDSQHLAYRAKIQDQDKYLLVLEQQEIGSYDYIPFPPVFSPDSKHLAYIGQKVSEYFGKSAVILDNQEGKSYDLITDITFSPNSKRLAYRALSQGKEFVVADNQEGKTYVHVEKITFSPDSQHLAYIAKKEPKYVGESTIVLDNQEGEFYYIIYSLVFSPDSKHLAYVAKTSDGQEFIILDGKKSKAYDSISAYFPTFSPNSEHLAYVVEKNGNKFVVVDERQASKTYDFISSDFLTFSPDSKHLAYVSEKDGNKFVVVDDQEGKAYNYTNFVIGDLIFSPDSQHLAYVVENVERQSPGELVEKTLSGAFLVLDGKEGKTYDAIYGKPIFSRDSKYIGYGARIDDELWWVVDKVE